MHVRPKDSRVKTLHPDEWKKLFELRDDLDGEDHALLRKLIKYVEHLEKRVRDAHDMLKLPARHNQGEE